MNDDEYKGNEPISNDEGEAASAIQTEMSDEERERYEQELIKQNVMKSEQVERERNETAPEPEPVVEEKTPAPKEKKEKKPVPKKRRGCGFHCCMTFLVFNFICCCLLIGVGWYFGDQYSRSYLDMSLTDTFSVVTGVTTSSRKLIDNEFDQKKDEAGFYNALGNAILLEEGALDGNEFKSTLMGGINSEEVGLKDVLENYMIDLISAENLDQNKIGTIGTPLQNTNLQLSDKQIGAFLNGVIGTAVDAFLVDKLNEAGLDKYGLDINKLSIKDYVSIEQFKLFVRNMPVGNANTDVNMARVTVSINFNKALKEIKKTINIDNLVTNNLPQAQSYTSLIKFGAKSAIDLVKAILPGKLYMTIDMGLSHNVEPTLYVNKMQGKKMDNLYKLLAKVNFDLKTQLNELFVGEDGAVKKALDNVNENVQLSTVLTDGGVNCDVYQLAIDLTGLNYTTVDGEKVLKPEDERITSDDVLQVMKLVLEDNTQYLEDIKDDEYNYKNVKFKTDAAGNLDLSSGMPVIESSGKQYYVTDKDELDKLLSSYEKLLISDFVSTYGLKSGYAFDDIIKAFSNSDTSSTLDMFDSEKFKEVLKGEAKGLELNDRMLGAMFMKMLPNFLKDTGFSEEDLGIEYIYIEKRQVNHTEGKKTHDIMHVGLNLKIDTLVGKISDNDLIEKMVNNLMANKNFIVEAGIDITLEMDQYIKSELKVNGNEANALSKIMGSLGMLGSDDEGHNLMLGGFIDNLMSPLRETIVNMGKVLPGLTVTESALKLPDIYAAIAGVLNMQGNGNLDGPTLEKVLKLLINEDPIGDPQGDYTFYADSNKQNVDKYYENCENELVKLLDKQYALKSEITKPNGGKYKLKLADLLYVLNVTKEPSSPEAKEILADTEMLDLLDHEILEIHALSDNGSNWKDRLSVNVTNNLDYNTNGSGDEFSALIREAMFNSDIDYGSLDGHFNKDNFMYATLIKQGEKSYIQITVKVVLKDIIDENANATQKFVKALLPDTPSLIDMLVDITKGETYDECVITLNDNDESSKGLNDMLGGLGLDLDFNEIGDSVRKAVLELDKTFNGVVFGDKVMVLPNVFSVINQVTLDGDYTDSDVKLAFAGVYKTSDTVAEEGSDKTRADVFEESLEGTAPAEDCSDFIKEIQEKYFLKEEVVKDKKTFSELSEVVDMSSFNASNIVMESENGKEGLGHTTKTETELKPKLDMENFGAMIVEKLPEKAKLHKMQIDKERNLVLHLSVEMNKFFENDNKNLSEKIGVNKLFVTMTIYLNQAPLEDAQHNKYYKSELVLNQMSNSNQNTLIDMMGKFNGSNGQSDMDKLKQDAGKSVYDAFQKLDSMYGKDGYSIQDDGIVLSDVFTFLGKNMIKKDSPKGEDVRKAIQGMYAKKEGTNERNYVESSIVVNKISTQSQYSDTSAANTASGIVTAGGIDDYDLGKYISDMTKDDDVEILQTNILAANPSNGSLQKQDRENLNKKLSTEMQLKDDTTYIVLTVKSKTTKLGEIGNNSKSVMPQEMIVSFILQWNKANGSEGDKNGKFEYKDFILNDMDAATRDVLMKLTGLDIDSVSNNIKAISKDSLDKLNSLFTAFSSLNVTANFEENNKNGATSETDNAKTSRGKYSVKNKDTSNSKSVA